MCSLFDVLILCSLILLFIRLDNCITYCHSPKGLGISTEVLFLGWSNPAFVFFLLGIYSDIQQNLVFALDSGMSKTEIAIPNSCYINGFVIFAR